MTEAFDYDKLPTGPDGRKRCKTCNGLNVVLLINDAPGDYPIIGFDVEDGYALRWTLNGQTGLEFSLFNLVMPSRKSSWANLYWDDDHQGSRWWKSYRTREEADRAAGPDRVACVEVEL